MGWRTARTASEQAASPRRQQMLGAVPMQRLGEPAEIAAAVMYFLSDGAGFTTGQTLFVDGGAFSVPNWPASYAAR